MNEILFEDIKGNSVLVDVRSPMEYKDGAIYGATNIPILNDEERKIVGTAYKQQSKNHARRIGLELVGNKLVGFFDSIIELKGPRTRQLLNELVELGVLESTSVTKNRRYVRKQF